MILFVTLVTDALGMVSHNQYCVSPADIDRGIYVDNLFPNSYGSFVKAIHVQSVDGGEAVQITSQYGSRKYSAYERTKPMPYGTGGNSLKSLSSIALM